MNKNESEDYKRGYWDGVESMQNNIDEAAIMNVMFGDGKLDDLSQRQLLKLGEENVAKLKADGK